jgi:hypothetical protein
MVGDLIDGNGVHEITVFVLVYFIGYYVVWKVTSALHILFVSITNAIFRRHYNWNYFCTGLHKYFREILCYQKNVEYVSQK